MSFVRTAAALQRQKTLNPPMAPGMELTVKYADTGAVLARQDFFDTISYTTDEQGNAVTRRQLPMGQLRLKTIMLVLTGWNLAATEDGTPFEITESNVKKLLLPGELEWLYDEIIAMNPVWGGEDGGES